MKPKFLFIVANTGSRPTLYLVVLIFFFFCIVLVFIFRPFNSRSPLPLLRRIVNVLDVIPLLLRAIRVQGARGRGPMVDEWRGGLSLGLSPAFEINWQTSGGCAAAWLLRRASEKEKERASRRERESEAERSRRYPSCTFHVMYPLVYNGALFKLRKIYPHF